MFRMFGRIGNTWNLMGASFDVLRKNKQLMVFPLLSGLAVMTVIASFAIPMTAAGSWRPPGEDAALASQVSYYGILFAFYVCNYFVILFFNSALIACAMVGLHGGKPSVRDGLRVAGARIGTIFGWTLVSATISIVLRIIEDRSETAGKIVSSLLGAAWAITSFLVLPVLVVEKKGPVEAFKRSASLLKQTWGEQLIGGFSFGLIFFLLAIPGALLIGAGFAAGGAAFTAVFVLAGGIYILLLMIVQPVLHSIFRAALYLYAINGETPAAFGRDDLLREAVGHRQ